MWVKLDDYVNMPMIYTAIFIAKNDDIVVKIFDFFLAFSQNIGCGERVPTMYF